MPQNHAPQKLKRGVVYDTVSALIFVGVHMYVSHGFWIFVLVNFADGFQSTNTVNIKPHEDYSVYGIM